MRPSQSGHVTYRCSPYLELRSKVRCSARALGLPELSDQLEHIQLTSVPNAKSTLFPLCCKADLAAPSSKPISTSCCTCASLTCTGACLCASAVLASPPVYLSPECAGALTPATRTLAARPEGGGPRLTSRRNTAERLQRRIPKMLPWYSAPVTKPVRAGTIDRNPLDIASCKLENT